MLWADDIAVWLTRLDLPLRFVFEATPEVPEFGVGDLVGTVVEVPSGVGPIRDGHFEISAIQILMRAPSQYSSELKRSFEILDNALRGVSNEDIWGVRVLYVRRPGGVMVDSGTSETTTIVTTYEIENG